jgi:hypothetical protein
VVPGERPSNPVAMPRDPPYTLLIPARCRWLVDIRIQCVVVGPLPVLLEHRGEPATIGASLPESEKPPEPESPSGFSTRISLVVRAWSNRPRGTSLSPAGAMPTDTSCPGHGPSTRSGQQSLDRQTDEESDEDHRHEHSDERHGLPHFLLSSHLRGSCSFHTHSISHDTRGEPSPDSSSRYARTLTPRRHAA